MPEDVPADAIERELARAEQMLDDARTAAAVDISKATVVNRLYYACFHAAQAALYSRGHDPRSHGRVQTLVGRELVVDGPVDRRHGRFLNDVGTYRRRVDYGSGDVPRESTDLVRETERFVEAMRRVVERA